MLATVAVVSEHAAGEAGAAHHLVRATVVPVNDDRPPVPENWWGDWRKFFGWLALGIFILVGTMVLMVWLIL